MVTRSVVVIEDEAVVSLFLADVLCNLNDEVCATAVSRRGAPERVAQARAPNGARSRGVSPLAILNTPDIPRQPEAVLADAFAQS
jgi:hypothetical protein